MTTTPSETPVCKCDCDCGDKIDQLIEHLIVISRMLISGLVMYGIRSFVGSVHDIYDLYVQNQQNTTNSEHTIPKIEPVAVKEEEPEITVHKVQAQVHEPTPNTGEKPLKRRRITLADWVRQQGSLICSPRLRERHVSYKYYISIYSVNHYQNFEQYS